jgi:hypothetical protein
MMLPWRSMSVVLAGCVLVAGCTSEPSVEDAPEQVARDAFEDLAGATAIGLTVTLDGQLTVTDAAETQLGADALLLVGGSTLEVRSSVGEAAHARVLTTGDARAALEGATEQLRAAGLGPLAERLLDEQWVRVSVPSPDDAEGDRLARGIGAAGGRLLDDAEEVTYAGRDELGEHIEVTAGQEQVHRFVDELTSVIASTGEGADEAIAETTASAPDESGRSEGDGTGPAKVDVWVDEGQLRALRFDVRGHVAELDGEPLLAWVAVDPEPDAEALWADAPPFALRALVSETLDAADVAAGEVEDEQAPADRRTGEDTAAEVEEEQPRDPEGEPAPLREGGVLEEVFGADNPFREDAEFDCVTDEDLEVLGQALGPEAVEEFEELIELGYLERC